MCSILKKLLKEIEDSIELLSEGFIKIPFDHFKFNPNTEYTDNTRSMLRIKYEEFENKKGLHYF